MSNKALNWALAIPLKGGQKSILLIIANAINKKGICWPNTETIMSWSGYSRRSVLQYLKDLVVHKVINRTYKHNKKGHRIGAIYSINFDLKVDQISSEILSANTAPRKRKQRNLGANTACLGANTACLGANTAPTPSYSITEPESKPKENHAFSLVDGNEQEKLETLIGVKFEELRKIYDYDSDILNARRLYKQLCLKNKRSLQFAENLIVAAKQQRLDRDRFEKAGEKIPAQCSLTKWLDGERWLDKIKPFGEKKKVSPYVKCKTYGCKEETLRGSNYCTRCTELTKPRVAHG